MTVDTAADFVLNCLMQLLKRDHELIVKVYEAKLIDKEQIEWVYEEMQFLRKFLKDSEEKRTEHEKNSEVKEVVAKIRDVIYEVEVFIDLFLVDAAITREERATFLLSDVENLDEEIHSATEDLVQNDGSKGEIVAEIQSLLAEKFDHGLEGVIEEIKFIKTEVMQIYEKNTMHDINGVPQIDKSSAGLSSRAISPTVEREILVGLEDVTTAIIDLLTEGHEMQLKLIPIVGMPGLGKTTLATTLYNDSFIIYHFYVRAWTHVSLLYQKRDLLLSILNSANIQLACDKLSDEKLGGELYKHLKGNRYLIVMDDIWNISAWNDLKRYFPNDNNGSRIIFTTRLGDVAVSLHAKPYYLRFLNEDEGWHLLQRKTFQDEICPTDLMEIGKRIAKKCGGLPLAIVVVSGLLAKNKKTQDWWRHVAESLSSYIVSDPEQYMDTLALSYNYLPNHLKSCFLYFGAFPEHREIPVWQLIWLWVAEGFIRKNESKSLEDVATDNLMDLIGRSLVIVSKKRFDGAIKACRIHDLLRDLCLRKAHEENFLHQISEYNQTPSQSSSSSSSLVTNTQRRLCNNSHLVDYIGTKHHALYVRSFLFLDSSFHNVSEKDVSFVYRDFKFLRVLNLQSVDVLFFPREIRLLIHLRYLSLYNSGYKCFNSSTSNLLNLETYIVGGFEGSVYLPDMWKMVKLRHLYTKRKYFELPSAINFDWPLFNIQTIGKLNLRGRNKQFLAWMPNLRKLKCVFDNFPKLDFLSHLETLHMTFDGNEINLKLPLTSWFPPNLKNLTFAFFGLPWEEMWTLGRLPNLEVLKLSYDAFEGSRWDTNDNEFRKLRFLKLQGLNIEQWNTSTTHFPNLQRLVLDRCQQLEEIPSGLGDISTLEMIQVRYCSSLVETSARQIQEQQQSLGNDGLKISIHSWRHN